MTIQEIKTAVTAGKRVYHQSPSYEVKKYTRSTGEDQWLIECKLNGYCIGLTNLAETRLNGKEEEFYTN